MQPLNKGLRFFILKRLLQEILKDGIIEKKEKEILKLIFPVLNLSEEDAIKAREEVKKRLKTVKDPEPFDPLQFLKELHNLCTPCCQEEASKELLTKTEAYLKEIYPEEMKSGDIVFQQFTQSYEIQKPVDESINSGLPRSLGVYNQLILLLQELVYPLALFTALAVICGFFYQGPQNSPASWSAMFVPSNIRPFFFFLCFCIFSLYYLKSFLITRTIFTNGTAISGKVYRVVTFTSRRSTEKKVAFFEITGKGPCIVNASNSSALKKGDRFTVLLHPVLGLDKVAVLGKPFYNISFNGGYLGLFSPSVLIPTAYDFMWSSISFFLMIFVICV
jgi:hypothetical protein